MNLTEPGLFIPLLLVALLLRQFPRQTLFSLTFLGLAGVLLLAASGAKHWYLPLAAPILVLTVWRLNRIAKVIVGALIIGTFFALKSGWVTGQDGSWSNPALTSLPLGFSFVMFTCLSLLIEGGRRSVICYSLMPFNLVAGPFLQANQLENMIGSQKPTVLDGVLLLTNGLFKKTLADNIQTHLIPVLSDSVADSWLLLLLMAARFYCDFSGYSDMARGYARIAGYDLPINFSLPYLSRTVQEFWSRWHISLGEWFRRYVFNPLAAFLWIRLNERLSPLLVNRLALVCTVLLVAIWHGLDLRFWLWGALTALVLLVPWPRKIWMWPITLYFIFWTQALILSPTISQWWYRFGLAHGLTSGYIGSWSWEMLAFTGVALTLPHLFDGLSDRQTLKMISVRVFIAGLQFFLIIPFSGTGVPFVYSGF